MATVQPQTKVLATIKTSTVKTAEELSKTHLGGRPLGSPINGKEEGDTFDVTLTGNIEIREFQGQKGAYFTTKEGYSIRVNASFNPTIYKADSTHSAVCRVLETENRKVKFCAFANA
jgi:hypothetical protein